MIIFEEKKFLELNFFFERLPKHYRSQKGLGILFTKICIFYLKSIAT